MSAAYQDLSATATARTVNLNFALQNRSSNLWTPAGPVCLGWQIYDPQTSLFIAEGDWADLKKPLPPQASEPFEFEIELPEEPGPYQIYLSPRDEQGWFYQQHWPFILVEAAVAAGQARVESAVVTTLGSMRWRHPWPKLKRAISAPFQTLWRNRRLTAAMVRREIAARYRGSLGDALWTLLHPLLLMLTYFFVFGIVLQARFGDDPSRAGFVLYFLAGMLPWLPMSEALGRAPIILIENRNFVKKLLFPVETLPINPVFAGLVTQGFALAIFLALLIATRGAVPLTILYLPAFLIPQLLLTMGACWFLSALGVYLRDLGQIIGFALTLVFFLTPICYPESALPAWAIAILSRGPVFILVRGYRAILLEASAPALVPLAALWASALLIFLAGHVWFSRLRRSFPDVM